MAYSISASINGVSKIEIGEVKSMERNGIPWQAVTIWLYDADGRLADSLVVQSDDNRKLAVEFEPKARAA